MPREACGEAVRLLNHRLGSDRDFDPTGLGAEFLADYGAHSAGDAVVKLGKNPPISRRARDQCVRSPRLATTARAMPRRGDHNRRPTPSTRAVTHTTVQHANRPPWGPRGAGSGRDPRSADSDSELLDRVDATGHGPLALNELLTGAAPENIPSR